MASMAETSGIPTLPNELPEEVRRDMTCIPGATLEDVLNAALPEAAAPVTA